MFAPPGSPGAPLHPPGPGFLLPPEARTPKRRPVGLIITVVLLAIALLAAGAIGTLVYLQLEAANGTIRDQQRELDEQREIIDQKEVFGAAMEALLDEVDAYVGVPMATIIPWDEYDEIARGAWSARWNPEQLSRYTERANDHREILVTKRETAAAEAATNSSGSAYEAVFDQLGAGHVTWVIEGAAVFCGSDAWACVGGENPYLVHVIDTADAEWWVDEWHRTGIAYHEMAHVLQFTNPEPTEEALEHFDGNWEHMADCFALTFLDGWALEQTIRSGRYIYDLSLGYGYTCGDTQREAMRVWYDQLGVQPRTVSS